MKTKMIVLLSIVAVVVVADQFVGCLPQETVDHDQLVERNGKHYKINSEIPFSGIVVEYYDNGQKKSEVTIKDGKLEGRATWWHDNGQKGMEATYKDGKLNGIETWWHDNGQKEAEGTYKDGVQEGIRTSWHYNGQKGMEETYKDGDLIKEEYFDRE